MADTHECWARRVAVCAAARHLTLASYHTFRGFQAPPVVSFKDRNTRLFFEGERVRAFRKFADQAVRRLTLLDRTDALDDLAVLPGNRLEALPGERAGQHSIRINAERRICFRWASDGPHDVEIVDDRSVGEGRGP